MNKLKLATILAGAALLVSPAHAAAETAAKPASMGIQATPHAEGAEITEMLPDRTAAAIGMKVGDIILEVEGKPISPEVAQEHAKKTKAGDQVSFKVKRAGAILELSGKALAAPEGAPAPVAQPQQ
jgi:S1-C subfamily serine protease